MNLLSQLSFSIFQVLGGQNISHPAIAETGWRSLVAIQLGHHRATDLFFERTQSVKDEVLS